MERHCPMVNASSSLSHPLAQPVPAPSRVARRSIAAPLGVGLAAALLLGGCTWLPDMPPLPGADLFETPRTLRGNLIEEEQLQQIVSGVSSRSDVLALLGSPSATSTFDDSEWFYIGGVTRQRPGQLLGIEDQRVVILRFDERGTVREVRRLGLDDGRDVVAVSRVTPSPGNERSFLQQLFGNIGRVGPSVSGGQAGGPGAPTTGGR
jgi:outer membrane protein assembly factor BamE (lipoprotein component of BamABCDE complex)